MVFDVKLLLIWSWFFPCFLQSLLKFSVISLNPRLITIFLLSFFPWYLRHFSSFFRFSTFSPTHFSNISVLFPRSSLLIFYSYFHLSGFFCICLLRFPFTFYYFIHSFFPPLCIFIPVALHYIWFFTKISLCSVSIARELKSNKLRNVPDLSHCKDLRIL